MIRLETSQGTGIDNYQLRELKEFSADWSRVLQNAHTDARQRTGDSVSYNCHGLTFASRRTNIDAWTELQKILSDDKYGEIKKATLLPGDIVIYMRDGAANHSGIIVDYTPIIHDDPLICSKWGSAGEFVHRLYDHPSAYGPEHKFYRCTL